MYAAFQLTQDVLGLTLVVGTRNEAVEQPIVIADAGHTGFRAVGRLQGLLETSLLCYRQCRHTVFVQYTYRA